MNNITIKTIKKLENGNFPFLNKDYQNTTTEEEEEEEEEQQQQDGSYTRNVTVSRRSITQTVHVTVSSFSPWSILGSEVFRSNNCVNISKTQLTSNHISIANDDPLVYMELEGRIKFRRAGTYTIKFGAINHYGPALLTIVKNDSSVCWM